VSACADGMPPLKELAPGRLLACWNPLPADGTPS
jgi:hypothetical protein